MSNWSSPPGSGQQPYAPPFGVQPYAPKPAGSNLWMWILLGVGGVLGLVCCGGLASMMVLGLNIAAQEVADQVRDNPKFREHIGELQEISMNFTASAAKDDGETFVYSVKGDKGSGTLTCKEKSDDNWQSVVEEATLRLPDGTEVQILP